MEDPQARATASSSSRPEICDEIGRAVGSLWQRRSGVRPASVSTEYVGDVVRCTIEQGDGAQADAEGDEAQEMGANAYDHEARAAVAKLTGRTVVGFIAKPVPAGAPATNSFILEANKTRY